jgi:hypothetical protein
MGLVCSIIVQPVIQLIFIIVSVIEFVLRAICRWVTELAEVLKQVLRYVCENVVRTVCDTVCGVVCGICDFFCGIFGCDCGCRNVCENVCDTVTELACGWTYVLEVVLDFVTRLVCNYIIEAFIRLLNFVVTLITMILTWVCSLIDLLIRWLMCITYLAELWDKIMGDTRQRRFRVAPRIVRNRAGYSSWFVYVGNADQNGVVDQNAKVYILSDQGRPLLPVVDRATGGINYFEVETRRNVITGELKRGRDKELVPGRPFLYYAYKVMEIASHMFGDIFATNAGDDGTGTNFSKNLFTYQPNVQAWLNAATALAANHYNNWQNKYTNTAAGDYFGDQTISDMGVRVDNDDTCSHPTNTFLHLSTDIEFPPPNNSVAEDMSCGAGQTLTFDETNYLMQHRHDGFSIATYFVSRYDKNDSHVGCNDLLGYTTVTFEGNSGALFVRNMVLEFAEDTNQMMSRIVQNIRATDIARVAETYIHELGHQSGLLHQEDDPDCADPTTLHIARMMNPGATVRRAWSRMEWCLIRGTWYITALSLTPFTQTAELPDSGSTPNPTPLPPAPQPQPGANP